MENKQKKALDLSEEILTDIELEQIPISSALLKCVRLARLLGDTETMEWLSYETGGYPTNSKGYLTKKAFNVALENGREIFEEGKQKIFSGLASQLEKTIETEGKSIGSVSTQGVSVGGDYANLALTNLARQTSNYNSSILDNIGELQRQLTILKGKYYEYALKVHMQLTFSDTVESTFELYKRNVDNELMKLAPNSIKKMKAIDSGAKSANSEQWSQALLSCRRLVEEVSNELYNIHFVDYEETVYETRSGRKLNNSGDKYLNRLYSVLDKLIAKSPSKTLLGSHIEMTVKWIDNMHDEICKGVHHNITYETVSKSIIHCYICLGDILDLHKDSMGNTEDGRNIKD